MTRITIECEAFTVVDLLGYKDKFDIWFDTDFSVNIEEEGTVVFDEQ